MGTMSNKEKYNFEKKCKCKSKKQKPVVINHSLSWHDGDVVCDNCKCFIRDYDAG